jgi:hypothetical protein
MLNRLAEHTGTMPTTYSEYMSGPIPVCYIDITRNLSFYKKNNNNNNNNNNNKSINYP